MPEKNPQAYPTLFYNQTTGEPNGHDAGMTLKDHFAGLAMQGICADGHTFWDNVSMQGNPEAIAKLSYEIADAMLKQREL